MNSFLVPVNAFVFLAASQRTSPNAFQKGPLLLQPHRFLPTVSWSNTSTWTCSEGDGAAGNDHSNVCREERSSVRHGAVRAIIIIALSRRQPYLVPFWVQIIVNDFRLFLLPVESKQRVVPRSCFRKCYWFRVSPRKTRTVIGSLFEKRSTFGKFAADLTLICSDILPEVCSSPSTRMQARRQQELR